MNLIFTPGPPEAVKDLDIEPSLTLVWTRPTNSLDQIDITYTVEINATDESSAVMNVRNTTSETSFSVQFLEEMLAVVGSQCVEFEFFVIATNEAGTGPSERILDTVPICELIKKIFGRWWFMRERGRESLHF